MKKLTIIVLATGVIALAALAAALARGPGSGDTASAATPTPVPVHYECYQINGLPPGVQVNIQTQFGEEQNVEVGPASLLCPPTLKTVVSPTPTPTPTPGTLNAPHLKCYPIANGQDPQMVVKLETQFGVEHEVVVGQAQRLCVPAVKDPIAPDLPPSGQVLPDPNYECFQITDPAPGFNVVLENQFGIVGPIPVGPATSLCAPAIVNGVGNPLNQNHLKCYDIQAPPIGWTVQLQTQFGMEQPLEVGPAQMLCVPAVKTVLGAVGGIADFPDDDGSPLSATDASGGSSFPYAAVAGGLAALVLLAAGGIYARRRFIRS